MVVTQKILPPLVIPEVLMQELIYNIPGMDWALGLIYLYDYHPAFASCRGIDSEILIGKTQYLAFVDKKRVVYNYKLVPELDLEDILYIIAHETGHVEVGDDIHKKGRLKRGIVAGLLFAILVYTFFPFLFIIPIVDKLIYFRNRRHIETEVDITTLVFTSMCVVYENIKNREPESRFVWLLYDHATTDLFAKKIKKRLKKDAGFRLN